MNVFTTIPVLLFPEVEGEFSKFINSEKDCLRGVRDEGEDMEEDDGRSEKSAREKKYINSNNSNHEHDII